MTRLMLVLALALVMTGCGRKGDPGRPEGAYADPAPETPIEQTDASDPVPGPLAPDPRFEDEEQGRTLGQ